MTCIYIPTPSKEGLGDEPIDTINLAMFFLQFGEFIKNHQIYELAHCALVN